ncbi:hypothetical protein C0995_003901 [Termitomyces sp. Mi166|nr:hypothetical protein C0995_003901 [Termitomyces sp. Mi166\
MAIERMRAMLMQNKDMYPTNVPPPIDPRFGNLGVPVGTIYNNRQEIIPLLGHANVDSVCRKELAESGIHTKTYAGISGSIALGAFSIVVSGGYADDDDQGDFLYAIMPFLSALVLIVVETGFTPALGHSIQVADQSFTHNDNRALQRSAETKRPVRVVRGSGASSEYAPEYGYRFVGMYVVEDAYLAKGVHGYAVCRYSLRRVSGQPPIPKPRALPVMGNVK